MQEQMCESSGRVRVRVKARIKDERMYGVELSGNFFLSPAKKLSVLEQALEGFAITDTEAASEVLAYVLAREDMRLVGVTPQEIASCIKQMEGSS